MKQKLLLLIAVLGGKSLAFSQSNPLFKYLSDDLTSVISIDAKNLGSKIPGETFRQSMIYRQMMKDPNSPFTLLSEPGKIGVDLTNGIVLGMKEEKANGFEKSQPEFCLFVKLQDAALFTSSIKKLMADSEDKIAVYGTNHLIISGGSSFAGWNNEVFMVSNAMAGEIRKSYMEMYLNDTTAPDPVAVQKEKDRIEKLQREAAFALLTPKPLNGISANKQFVEALTFPADIKVWSKGNSNPFAERVFPMASLLEKLQGLTGNISTSWINFENGKIVMEGQNFPNETMADIYKKYPPGSQNLDLVKRLPPGALLGLANITINQQMAQELLQKTGLLELLDSMKKDIPFDLSLLPGTFKSNMMVAVVKSGITTDMDNWTNHHGGLQLIIAMPIADKVRFQKLKSAIPSLVDTLKKAKEDFFQKTPLTAKHNDDLLVITLSPQTADAFLNHSGNGEVPAILQQYRQYPMVLSVGLGEIFSSIGAGNSEDSKKGMMASVMSKFDKVLVYGGKFENGSIGSRMEFRFSDPNENALKQLFDMVTSIAEKEEAKRAEMDDDDIPVMDSATMMMDTAAWMAPIAIPTFKDPVVQESANEYAAFIDEYLSLMKTGKTDSSSMAPLGKKGELMGQHMDKAMDILTKDPEELKKFTEWISEVSRRLTGTVQQVTLTDIKQEEDSPEPPPPPPPAELKKKKVEVKKVNPPTKKKN
jgi:hypothetical protein